MFLLNLLDKIYASCILFSDDSSDHHKWKVEKQPVGPTIWGLLPPTEKGMIPGLCRE